VPSPRRTAHTFTGSVFRVQKFWAPGFWAQEFRVHNIGFAVRGSWLWDFGSGFFVFVSSFGSGFSVPDLGLKY